MSDILKYKGYEGTVEVDMTLGICRGRVLFIKDLITFEAESPKKLRAEFEAAVDDYLETCHGLKREPQRPASGQFSVRTDPQIHMDAIRRAIHDDTSLNSVVISALKCYLYSKTEINNNYVVVKNVETGHVVTTNESAVVPSPYSSESDLQYPSPGVWH